MMDDDQMSLKEKESFIARITQRAQNKSANFDEADQSAPLSPEAWLERRHQERQRQHAASTPVNEEGFAHFKASLMSQSASVEGPIAKTELVNSIAAIVAKESREWGEIANDNGEVICGSDPLIAALQQEAADEGVDLSFQEWAAKQDGKEGGFIALSTAVAGASETGTLFFISGNENPTPLNFLSTVHIALINRGDIVGHYEEAFAKCLAAVEENNLQSASQNNEGAEAGKSSLPPRAINMISGPSRTADIEQTLTLSAHGPIRLYVLVWQ